MGTIMNTTSLLVLAAGGLSLLGSAVAEVSLPAVMYRSNAVYSLYEAAAAHAPGVIAARLSEGVAVNQPDEQGNTALHIAAAANDNDIVQMLLSGGADPMAKDAQGRIPSELTMAEDCRMNLARAEALRAQEIALGESILSHDLAAVQQGMRARLNPSAFAGDGIHTFLMLAVRENQPEIVNALLAAGADAKGVSPEQQYGILHVAVQSGRADMIPALLAAGADPLHMAANGATALHDAVWNGDVAAVRALLPAYKSCNFIPSESGQPAPLGMAVSRGNTALVKLFLEAGCDPNVKGTGKHRADDPVLHIAAKSGKADIVKLLLEAGADKTARNYDGQTAVEVAAPEVADLLR